MSAEDRELLELAAKASGLSVKFEGSQALCLRSNIAEPSIFYWWPWNPLTDDGDALRLAVKLGLLVGPNSASREPTVFAWAREQGCIAQYQGAATDPHAATRRAITRAAAEIGRAMP